MKPAPWQEALLGEAVCEWVGPMKDNALEWIPRLLYLIQWHWLKECLNGDTSFGKSDPYPNIILSLFLSYGYSKQKDRKRIGFMGGVGGWWLSLFGVPNLDPSLSWK